MWEERDKLKELLNKKEPELEDWENSQRIPIPKNEKACSEQNTKGAAGQALHQEITYGFNRSSKQKPGIGEIFLAETLPIWTKGQEEFGTARVL